MKALRSPLMDRISRSDAHRASFGFASEQIKGARLHGFEFRQGVDNDRSKRQVGEVDRSTNGRVYFRSKFAIKTTVRNGSQADLNTDITATAAIGVKQTSQHAQR